MQPRQPAYSLIFALIYMTLIMFIAVSSVEGTNDTLYSQRGIEESIRAQLAAQSAAELGIVAVKDFNAGYSLPFTEKTFCLYADSSLNSSGDGDCTTWGNVTVYSSAMENSNDFTGFFYTPMPGTGSAASGDDCTIRDRDHDGDFDDNLDVDHPCNWNKLRYGESVTIPLTTDDGSGGILTPADFFNFNGWQLKVRTPCADTPGKPDEAECSMRFTMDENDSTGTFDSGGDSVIFWQLIGESDTDGDGVGDTTMSVLPNDEPDEVRGNTVRNAIVNTEIYEGLINDAGFDSVVLDINESSSAPFDEIYNTCMDSTLTNLSLQLNIVTPLMDNGGDPIPYLEWQLLSNASEPFGDTKAIVIGEGYHKGANRTFYYSQILSRATTGESLNIYTLSN